jgi:hypothetical protein
MANAVAEANRLSKEYRKRLIDHSRLEMNLAVAGRLAVPLS